MCPRALVNPDINNLMGWKNYQSRIPIMNLLKFLPPRSFSNFLMSGSPIQIGRSLICINLLAGLDQGLWKNLKCTGKMLIWIKETTIRAIPRVVNRCFNRWTKRFMRRCCSKGNYWIISSAELQESSYIFQASDGGLSRLDSLKKRFSQQGKLAGIPKGFHPNYCLQGTVALMMLSNVATLAEVAHQLGQIPGFHMTWRYARLLASAQQNIADWSQSVIDKMLKWRIL